MFSHLRHGSCPSPSGRLWRPTGVPGAREALVSGRDRELGRGLRPTQPPRRLHASGEVRRLDTAADEGAGVTCPRWHGWTVTWCSARGTKAFQTCDPFSDWRIVTTGFYLFGMWPQSRLIQRSKNSATLLPWLWPGYENGPKLNIK